MPKVNLIKKKHLEMSVVINGTAVAEGKYIEDMAKMTGLCRKTMSKRLENVGTLTLNDLVALGRGLHIPIDELRNAIRY